MKNARHFLQFALPVSMALLASTASAANTIPVKMTGWAYGTEDIKLFAPAHTFPSQSATSLKVGVGEFKGTVTGLSGYSNITANGSFLTYCLDLGQTFGFNNNYLYDQIISAETKFGATKADELGRFYTAYASLANNTATSVAFQLGLWEIITESTNNALSLSNGSFRAVAAGSRLSNDNADISLANSWLANLGNLGPSQYTISVLFDAQRQDFLLAAPIPAPVPAPIPEPETWAMLLAGFGLMASIAKRRQRKN